MAFKMKGSPLKRGTIQGTAGHASALKNMKTGKYKHSFAKKASPWKDVQEGVMADHNHVVEEGETQEEANARHGHTPGGNKPEEEKMPPKNDGGDKPKEEGGAKTSSKAYGGTKTWEEGQKDSGGTLNDTTRAQKEYEKKKKAEDPNWNKREDMEWKKRQNKINKALGSSKVYDTTRDIATKENKDGEKVMRGVGSGKGKTLTAEEKSAEKAAISTQRDIVDKAKNEGDKDARDRAQMEIGEIKGGRDNEKTGTVVSRAVGKGKAAINRAQIANRKFNEALKAWRESGKEGPRPTRAQFKEGAEA